MSLIDLGIEAPFSLPESPSQLANNNTELADFLGNLQRPIGLIRAEVAPEYVIDAAMSEEQQLAFNSVDSLSRRQDHSLGVYVAAGFTEFGDRSVSLLSKTHSKRGEDIFHQAASLVLVEGRFLFGHSHIFRNLARPTGSVLRERDIKPMKLNELDSFNVVHHRVKLSRELLRIAS